MIRRIALAGVAGALALGGLAASGIGTAGAATVTITTATSANISCSITAKAKIAPALKNNWDQQVHEAADGETNADVSAIPDTKFSSDDPNTVSSKAKSISCTGTATNGPNTATITGVKVTLGSGTPAVDNPPLQVDNTCSALLAGTPAEDVPATYNTTITFKTSPGVKLAPTTTAGQTIATSGAGFAVAGGTVGGSLAGGTGKTQANISDTTTIPAVAAQPATSLAPFPNRTCEANLKIKTGVHHAASLKGPKGLKKIGVGQSSLDPSPAGASTLCLRKGSSCP
jgi:hypothetical protein